MNASTAKIILVSAFIGLLFAGGFVMTQYQQGHGATPIPPGGVAFGPETFVRTAGKPDVFARSFTVPNSQEEFIIQVLNGEGVESRISAASISLNGDIIVSPNNFNQKISGLSKDVTITESNTLHIRLESVPEGQITITVRRRQANPTISNADNDLVAGNDLESVGMTWDHDERATEYIILRSESSTGPFIKVGHVPAGIDISTNATDITPDARTKTLCYKIEAVDERGRVFRIYEPVCVPPYQPNPHELEGLSNRVTPDRFCFNTQQFSDISTMPLADIREFLAAQDSFLIRQTEDVDGEPIDVPEIIFNVAQTSQINPQVILGTLERESTAITRDEPPRSERTLRLITGFDPNNIILPLSEKSIREQIEDVAAQYRRDLNRLAIGNPTAGGWNIEFTTTTDDGIDVTPETAVSAAMFSYDPEVGIGWGGNTNLGGNFFFCQRWAKFEFPIPPQPVNLLTPTPADITTDSIKLTWEPPQFPDPDFAFYLIRRGTVSPVTENSDFVTVIAQQSAITFTDTGLDPGTEYFYKIFVFDADNLSSESNEVSATTKSEGILGTPHVSVIDSSGDLAHPALAIGPTGFPSVSYVDFANGLLKFATYNGSSWTIEVVGSINPGGFGTSLSFDKNGLPAITYYNEPFFGAPGRSVAFFDGSNWTIELVDGPTEKGIDGALAFDASNTPFLAYYEQNAGDLKLAKRVGGVWVKETIDSAGNTGRLPDIIFDHNNNPVIAYNNIDNANVRIALKINGSFTIKEVDPLSKGPGGGPAIRLASLSMANNGDILLAYTPMFNSETGAETFDLKLARIDSQTGNVLSFETIEGASAASQPDLAFNEELGIIAVPLFDTGSQDLKLTTIINGSATTQTLDSAGIVGIRPSVEFNDAGFINIAYEDNTNFDIKFVEFVQ